MLSEEMIENIFFIYISIGPITASGEITKKQKIIRLIALQYSRNLSNIFLISIEFLLSLKIYYKLI